MANEDHSPSDKPVGGNMGGEPDGPANERGSAGDGRKVAAASDETQGKQSNLIPWQPGQSGNPAGRPKGARVKLGEQFLGDLLEDWEANGKTAIIDMRAKNPGDYVKVVAATLPKELNVKVSELDELSDEQIARQLAHVASQLAAAGFDLGKGIGAPETPQQPSDLPTLQ